MKSEFDFRWSRPRVRKGHEFEIEEFHLVNNTERREKGYKKHHSGNSGKDLMMKIDAKPAKTDKNPTPLSHTVEGGYVFFRLRSRN